MVFTKDEIDMIKSSNNIIDVIGQRINLEKKGKNYFCVCPFHDDHAPSMSVSEEKQIYKCFSCGAYGNVITFIEEYESMSFQEALQLLADRAGIKTNGKISVKESKNEFKKYYEINSIVSTFYKNNLLSTDGIPAMKYLTNRGITKDAINNFDIGLSTNNKIGKLLSKKYEEEELLKIDVLKEINGRVVDSFTNRIIFPIKDDAGNIVGFSGRIYTESDEPKYYNTTETIIFKKSNILYNLDNAKKDIKSKKEIIIVEGYMDAIRLYINGYKNVVALMGTSLTKENLEKIIKLKCNIVLNLDQDGAGENATVSIGDELVKHGINPTVIKFEDYKDSDEFIVKKGKDAFDTAYRNKISFIDFKLKYLKKNKNLKDSYQASEFINNAIKAIEKLDDEILKELKINEIAEEFNIDVSVIKSKINDKVKEKETKAKKEKIKRYNKYDISEIRIIYLMIMNIDVITYFENALGYLINNDKSALAYKIVEFKNDYGYFDFSDFIDYISENEKLNEILKEIMRYPNNEEYTDEELEDYFKTIKEYNCKWRISVLKEQMKNTLDINKKIELGERIKNITKEVKEW